MLRVVPSTAVCARPTYLTVANAAAVAIYVKPLFVRRTNQALSFLAVQYFERATLPTPYLPARPPRTLPIHLIATNSSYVSVAGNVSEFVHDKSPCSYRRRHGAPGHRVVAKFLILVCFFFSSSRWCVLFLFSHPDYRYRRSSGDRCRSHHLRRGGRRRYRRLWLLRHWFHLSAGWMDRRVDGSTRFVQGSEKSSYLDNFWRRRRREKRKDSTCWCEKEKKKKRS